MTLSLLSRTLVLTACVGLAFGAAPACAKTLEAVASFTVLADVIQHVGGKNVHVTSLVGPNGDPHEFEPTPDNAKSAKNADIIFLSGEGLEIWFERLVVASGYEGKPVIVSQGMKTHDMDEDGARVTDPHVWNSAANVIVWVANIEKALSAADPQGAASYKANAETYTRTLQALNRYAIDKIAAVPAEKRKVLTSHDAFGYFSAEYGVAFLSPIGVSTENEASAGDVAKLIDQIRREGVKVYFIENSNDPRLIKQIAEATGAEPGGELYVESLSAADGPASTYEKMFKYNVDHITAAIAK